MKNTTQTGLMTLMAACMICASFFAQAQNEADLAAFLKSTKEDANVLITGYTAPIVRGASYAMTGGWYTTAKTHKSLGFDIGVSVTAAITPKSDNYFDPRPQLSQYTTFTNSTNPTAGAPTFVGPKDQTSYTTTVDGKSVTFAGPEGLDLKKSIKYSVVPVPMIQVGIGVIKNTDLKIRFMPAQKRGDSKVSMFGIGVMHDIKQYLPGHDVLPFDLSILAAFNSVKGTTTLVNDDVNSSKPVSSNGAINYKLNSWVAQAIISKKISVLTGYLGVGYGSVSTNADITGTFSYNVSDPQTQGTVPVSITDPFATTFKNKTLKVTAGLRLKFGPFYLVGDYTLQKYNALTVGLGFAFR